MIKGVIRNTAIQTGGKAMMVLISLVTTGILTRKLGVNGYGAFTLTTSIFLLIDALADMGTRMIGVREAARANDMEEKRLIWINIIWLRKMLALAAVGLGLLIVLWYPGFEGFRWWAVIALMMSFGTSIAGDEEIIFQTESRLDLKALIDILYPIGFLGLVLVFGENLNLGWVFGGYLISRVMSLLVGVTLIKKQIPKISSIKPDYTKIINRQLMKQLLKKCWPMGVYMLVFISYDRAVDSTMIRAFLDESAVAHYGLAYKIYSNLITPAYFLASAIFPVMSKKETGVRTKSLILAIGMIAMIVPVVIWLAPWMIYLLAGSGFESSVAVLRILMISLIFSYLSHILGFELIANEGQKELLYLGVAALIINVGLNWLTIPYFGISAAAWVTVATEGVMLMLTIASLSRK